MEWSPSWHEGSGPPALEFGTEPSYLDHGLDAQHDNCHVDESEGRECEVNDVQQQYYFGARDSLEMSDQQHSFYDDRSSFGIDGRLASLPDRRGGVLACASVSEDDDRGRDLCGQQMQHQSYHHDAYASLHDVDGSASGNYNHDVDDNEIDSRDADALDHQVPAVATSEARAHTLWLIDTLVELWWSDNADEGGHYIHQFPSFRLSNTEFKCVDSSNSEPLGVIFKTSQDSCCAGLAARRRNGMNSSLTQVELKR